MRRAIRSSPSGWSFHFLQAAQAISSLAPLPIGWDDILRKIQCPSAQLRAECKPPPLPSFCARLVLIWAALTYVTFWTWIGWAITALAISFGAPFWFDALGDVLKLRAAGPKPLRADDPANSQNAT